MGGPGVEDLGAARAGFVTEWIPDGPPQRVFRVETAAAPVVVASTFDEQLVDLSVGDRIGGELHAQRAFAHSFTTRPSREIVG